MNTKPHVIYLLSDEHRGQAMSHRGDPNVRTPWMDRLAREGVSFRRAYANCPICTPSRGTIFSGRHAHAGPVSGFFDVYKAAAPSIATELRRAGYRTAYFGKWHCGIYWNQAPPGTKGWCEYAVEGQPHRAPEHHRGGFEDWFSFELNNHPFDGQYWHQDELHPRPLPGFQTNALTDLAIQYLRDYDRDQPLFLVLSVEPPHFPLAAPPEFLRRFDPAKLWVSPNFTDTPEMRRELATYYAMIENLDWNIGRFMEALAVLPRFRDTLTVYFSDHGDYMGSHGLVRRKEHPHEESVRIPAIFHWPGRIPARGDTDGMFSLVDLMATTLGAVGQEIPAWNQGLDWSPLLWGKPLAGPKSVLLEMVGSPRWALNEPDWRGLVTEQFKYAYYETGQQLLFDLHADPFEQHNLAAEDVSRCAELRGLLLQALAETREPFFDVLISYGVAPPQRIGDMESGSFKTLSAVVPF